MDGFVADEQHRGKNFNILFPGVLTKVKKGL